MKFFLLIFFLIPFNLFSISELEVYGNWAYQYTIDDFTDEKTNIVQAKQNDNLDRFTIVMREPKGFTWSLDIGFQICGGTEKKYKEEIPVLFRVDKNEVLTLMMRPREQKYSDTIDRTKLILAPNKNSQVDILYYYLELQDGNNLKIRVDDPVCKYKHDTDFSLDGFTKAFAPMDKLIQDKLEKEMEKRGLN